MGVTVVSDGASTVVSSGGVASVVGRKGDVWRAPELAVGDLLPCVVGDLRFTEPLVTDSDFFAPPPPRFGNHLNSIGTRSNTAAPTKYPSAATQCPKAGRRPAVSGEAMKMGRVEVNQIKIADNALFLRHCLFST